LLALLLELFAAKRLRLRAQGRRFGYPGLRLRPDWRNPFRVDDDRDLAQG